MSTLFLMMILEFNINVGYLLESPNGKIFGFCMNLSVCVNIGLRA